MMISIFGNIICRVSFWLEKCVQSSSQATFSPDTLTLLESWNDVNILLELKSIFRFWSLYCLTVRGHCGLLVNYKTDMNPITSGNYILIRLQFNKCRVGILLYSVIRLPLAVVIPLNCHCAFSMVKNTVAPHIVQLRKMKKRTGCLCAATEPRAGESLTAIKEEKVGSDYLHAASHTTLSESQSHYLFCIDLKWKCC